MSAFRTLPLCWFKIVILLSDYRTFPFMFVLRICEYIRQHSQGGWFSLFPLPLYLTSYKKLYGERKIWSFSHLYLLLLFINTLNPSHIQSLSPRHLDFSFSQNFLKSLQCLVISVPVVQRRPELFLSLFTLLWHLTRQSFKPCHIRLHKI